jgi:hypothetical protein
MTERTNKRISLRWAGIIVFKRGSSGYLVYLIVAGDCSIGKGKFVLQ